MQPEHNVLRISHKVYAGFYTRKFVNTEVNWRLRDSYHRLSNKKTPVPT